MGREGGGAGEGLGTLAGEAMDLERSEGGGGSTAGLEKGAGDNRGFRYITLQHVMKKGGTVAGEGENHFDEQLAESSVRRTRNDVEKQKNANDKVVPYNRAPTHRQIHLPWLSAPSVTKLFIIEGVCSIEGDGICILTGFVHLLSKCANTVNILSIYKFPRSSGAVFMMARIMLSTKTPRPTMSPTISRLSPRF